MTAAMARTRIFYIDGEAAVRALPALFGASCFSFREVELPPGIALNPEERFPGPSASSGASGKRE